MYPSSLFFSPTTTTDLLSPRVSLSFLRIRSNPLNLSRPRSPFVVFQNLQQSDNSSSNSDDDFITRVLKQNPTQVETKYLVGDRFVTLREKQSPTKDSIFKLDRLVKRLLGESESKKRRGDSSSSNPVYLKDILREFKGNLYVPEEVFRESLSEEEEFEKDLKELPLMRFEELEKHLKAGKIKMLTSRSKSAVGGPQIGLRDFVVELENIVGEKSLQNTKW